MRPRFVSWFWKFILKFELKSLNYLIISNKRRNHIKIIVQIKFCMIFEQTIFNKNIEDNHNSNSNVSRAHPSSRNLGTFIFNTRSNRRFASSQPSCLRPLSCRWRWWQRMMVVEPTRRRQFETDGHKHGTSHASYGRGLSQDMEGTR